MNLKLLLHVCCACCSTEVIERLKQEYDLVLFFSNSNIFPKEEYERRLESARMVARDHKLELIEEEYDNDKWEEFVSSVPNYKVLPEKGERCRMCFKFNLIRTAKMARERGIGMFATTLTISPHKDNVLINNIGKDVEKMFGVKYMESNFKENDGFKKSVKHSKQLNLYRQNYCGCRYSMRG
jgi:predicted adenine nucleotide alpha hydrolase (AANH) superfamily ATPase